jgi:hypothetical protein
MILAEVNEKFWATKKETIWIDLISGQLIEFSTPLKRKLELEIKLSRIIKIVLQSCKLKTGRYIMTTFQAKMKKKYLILDLI